MGLLSWLFGSSGEIHFVGTLADGRTAKGKCKMETVGMDQSEVEVELKQHLYIHRGLKFVSLKIVAFEED